jgi:elongation factor 2
LGEIIVDPSKGNVAFGSGKECWAFTITKFARIYSSKFKIEYKKLMEKLWGDNYFDAGGKKWKTDNTADDGKMLKRAFA